MFIFKIAYISVFSVHKDNSRLLTITISRSLNDISAAIFYTLVGLKKIKQECFGFHFLAC